MKKFLLVVAAVSVLAACSKDESAQEPQKGSMQSIKVSVAPFSGETKTAVTPTGGFTWSAGDQIGIYPVASTLGAGQTSQQIVFKINTDGNASSATFTGTGWGLITNGNYKYISYYPYSADAKYNEASIVISDNLNQTENASTAHLGVNDYLYAPQIQPTSAASANFAFYHLSALVEFEITVPEDAKTKAFTRMTVTAPESVFTVSGKYDPSSATETDAPAITDNVYTDKMTLKFNGGAGFTPDAEGKIHAYFLIAPAAVQGKTLNLKFWDVDNVPYIATTTPKTDIASQQYKRYSCEAIIKPTTMVTNLSEGGTANCYIVPEWGRYKFLANVRGNGVDPVADDSEGPVIDMTGCTANVIWETVNTNVAPAEGSIVANAEINGEFIEFNATGTEGNALIALKNSDGKIVWSWHIWVTSADLDALKQTYPNNAGVMMDRNLGALSATPGDGLTLGFHYQWGRPFPITGGSSDNGAISSTRMATTNSSVWVEEETSATKGTLAYSAANPTHFIYASASNYYKGQTSGNISGNWLWTADAETGYTSATVPLFWGSAKTMYDPSPVGWKVPQGSDSYGVWATAGFSAENLTWNGKGGTFTPSAAYYPAAGYRGAVNTAQGGVLGLVGVNGFFWSSSANGSNSCHMTFGSSSVLVAHPRARAFGLAVRPCQE